MIFLEIKALLRRPVWVLLAAFAAWVFLTNLFGGSAVPSVSLGLELPFLGRGRGLFSMGEWGRSILLTLEAIIGVVFSLFVALIAIRACVPEIAHRDVLWATLRGGTITAVKLVAVSLTATTLMVLGAGTAFLNPAIRETVVLAGWMYVPLYLTLAWVRIAVWVALCMALFYVVRSQVISVMVVLALQTAWLGTAGIWGAPSLLRLLHRNLLAWNYVDIFAPLGVIPTVLSLQGVVMVGVVFALLGASLWARKRFPEWKGTSPLAATVVLAVGIVLAAVGGGGIIHAIQQQVAPFTALALWEGRAELDRPYIWSADFRFISYPGEYIAVRLPTDTPIPTWVEEASQGRELRRYEVGTIILQGHLGEEEKEAATSLVFIFPDAVLYPAELAGAAHQFRREIRPLVKRASLWLGREEVEAVVAWPSDAYRGAEVYLVGDELLIDRSLLMLPVPVRQWTVSAQLAKAAGLAGPETVYLGVYLMAGVDREQAELGIKLVPYIAAGRWWEAVHLYEFDFRIMRGLRAHVRDPGIADLILRHWQRGEELGHENYIRTLLEGRN